MSLVPWKTTSPIPVLRARIADDIAAFQRSMNNLTNSFSNAGDVTSPLTFDTSFFPLMDLKEKEDKYVIDVDMPGLNESDISIDFHNNILTIKGEKKQNQKLKTLIMSVLNVLMAPLDETSLLTIP